jgi:hypothetical protein
MSRLLAQDLRLAIFHAALSGKLSKRINTDGNVIQLLNDITEEKKKIVSEGKIKSVNFHLDITEDKEPFKIPSKWKWEAWGNISNSIQYGVNAGARPIGNVKLVRISDIKDNKINWNNVPWSKISENDIVRYRLNENDILFARTGGTVGKSVIVKNIPSDGNIYVFAGYLIRSTFSSKIDYRYLKIFMESELYWSQLRNGTIGSAQPNCNGKTLSRMMVPIPPIEEQKRIADRLEQFMIKINEYEMMENQLKEMIKGVPQKMREALLEAAFQGKMTTQNKFEIPLYRDRGIRKGDYKFKLPSNWTVVRLSSISDLYTGNSISEFSKKTKYFGQKNGFNYIGTKDVGFDHKIVYENGVKIPHDEPKFKIAKKNATLLCIEGGSAGRKIGILSEDICFGNKLCAFNPRKYINYKFQYYLIQSPLFEKMFVESTSGMIGGVALSKLKRMLVPLPPLEEQLRIVERLDGLFSLIDEFEKLI